MGTAVSFQNFPVDLRKLDFFPSHEKASPSNKPMVTTREKNRGQLPCVVPPRLESSSILTAPQYRTAAHRQPAATLKIDRANVQPNRLTAHVGKADIEGQIIIRVRLQLAH